MTNEYRVDEIAALADVSVDLLRSYQSRGLLPPPRHEGRVAWYDRRHLERLRRIRELKDHGYSLKMIRATLERADGDHLDGADASDVPLDTLPEEPLTLGELADRCGVHPAMLRSLAASGVIRPRRFGADLRYTTGDVRAVRMLLALLGSGVPMEEFMQVAGPQIAASREVATGAVELFWRFVREPLREQGLSQREEAERLVASLRLMIHAATSLMSYNFQRVVLNAAQELIEREGTRSERVALGRELERRRFEVDGLE